MQQFDIRRNLSLKLQAFMAFRDNLYDKIELRENVLREASLISFEENYSIKEACFAELKENVVN